MTTIYICPYCDSSNITQICEVDVNSKDIINYYDDYICQECENTFKYPNKKETNE